MVRVALCYWGLTRSTRHIAATHKKHLRDVLTAKGIPYDCFVHTWNTTDPHVWGKQDRPISKTEGFELEPTHFHMDHQDDFLTKLDFSLYFNADVYAKYGDSKLEWRPELILNHLCALQSLRQVYRMMQLSGRTYDFVICMRPDMELLSDFPVSVFDTLGPKDIAICNHSHHEGWNDRFAVLPFAAAAPYMCRFESLLAFKAERGRIVSEKVVKYIVDKHYNRPTEVEFAMRRVRSDGTREAT